MNATLLTLTITHLGRTTTYRLPPSDIDWSVVMPAIQRLTVAGVTIALGVEEDTLPDLADPDPTSILLGYLRRAAE